MTTTLKISRKKIVDETHLLIKRFDTAEEASKAKTDYLMTVVFKDVDWKKVGR